MTTEEFKEKHFPNHYWDENSAKELAVEFAKYHVEQALKTASENAVVYADEGGCSEFVDEKSITNAYSLENIK